MNVQEHHQNKVTRFKRIAVEFEFYMSVNSPRLNYNQLMIDFTSSVGTTNQQKYIKDVNFEN